MQGNSLQVTEMENHAKGNLKRHKATGPRKKSERSAHDTRVANFPQDPKRSPMVRPRHQGCLFVTGPKKKSDGQSTT